MLMKDGALQTFDKAVRPGMSRLGSGVADAEVVAGGIEVAFEFTAPVGKHSLKRPSCGFVEGQEDVHEESNGVLSGIGRNDACGGVRTGRIAGRDLPDFPDPLEAADVERVEADELPGLTGLDMASLPTGSLQFAPGALSKQSGALCAVLFEDDKSLRSCAQSHTTQRTVDGAGRQMTSLSSQLLSIEPGATGRIRQGQGQDRLFVLDRQVVRTSLESRLSLRMESISTVALISILPAVKQRAGNPQLSTGRRDIAELSQLTRWERRERKRRFPR